MTYGLTDEGFRRKTVEVIVDEMSRDARNLISANLDTQPETPIGQIFGIVGSKMGEIWELMEAVNDAQDPRKSIGEALDGISAITGTDRSPATKGTVVLRLSINSGTTVPAGSIASVDGDDSNRWVTLASVTNSTGSPADFDVEAEAETAGDIPATAGTITVIVTPVSGWTAVTNDLDADSGDDIDTDTELRVRRVAELALAGSSTPPGIEADLLQVAGVTAVTVINNPVGSVNPIFGLPFWSFEAVVLGGADEDVAEALFKSAAAGAQMVGSTTVNHVDEHGETQVIKFTRPTPINVYLSIDVSVDAEYPATGDTLIAVAIAEFGDDTYDQGDDVILSALQAVIFSIPGIVDVTAIRVGTAPAPSQTTNLVVSVRELALLDTSRITVTSTPI